VTRLEDERGARQEGEGSQDPEGLKPHDVLHRQSHQSQRMPAPSVRAIDATSASTQVKRARFDFTCDSVSEDSCALDPAAGRSSGKIPGFASPPRGGFALDGLGAEDVRPHCRPYGGPGPGHMAWKY
jgi:hypothetical protein